jgi:hypothetical protein
MLNAVMAALDWTGHVELPANDLRWLAGEIYKILSPTGIPDLCGICGGRDVTTIRTLLGPICVGCIEDLHEEVT